VAEARRPSDDDGAVAALIFPRVRHLRVTMNYKTPGLASGGFAFCCCDYP
jgi:hypothetical protein